MKVSRDDGENMRNLLPSSYPCSAGTCETNDAGGIVESDIGREKLYVLTPVPPQKPPPRRKTNSGPSPLVTRLFVQPSSYQSLMASERAIDREERLGLVSVSF